MLRKPSILVVEDEPLVREFLTGLLTEEGFDVRPAADGAGAIRELQDSAHLTASIVDLGLPDIPGEDVAALIHAQRPELPLIIATGHDPTRCGDRFVSDPNVRLLLKPFDCSGVLNMRARAPSVFRVLKDHRLAMSASKPLPLLLSQNLSIGLPFASSSISLSRRRILCISGSCISSTR